MVKKRAKYAKNAILGFLQEMGTSKELAKELYENKTQEIVDMYKFYHQCANLEKDLENLSNQLERFENYGEKNNLTEKVTGILGIGGLVTSLYFLAPNFTGNVIGNLEMGNTNLFGLFNIFVCIKKSKS